MAEIKAHDLPKTFIARDPRGVVRISATDRNVDVAETRCGERVRDFIKDKPHYWPLAAWRVERVRKS